MRKIKQYEKSWAVIIGIDDYQNVPKLENAVNDAKRLALTLKKIGFDEIIELYDDEATKESIITHFIDDGQLPSKINKDDRLLVFFAGHGTVFTSKRNDNQSGYIVPYNGKKNKKSSLIEFRDLVKKGLEEIPAKHVLFLMDCCFSGIAAITRSLDNESYAYNRMELEKTIERCIRKDAVQIITAGQDDELVLDTSIFEGHSPFTGAIIDGIESGEADMHKDGVLTASELGTYLDKKVSDVANVYGHTQNPFSNRLPGDKGGDFILHVKPINPQKEIKKHDDRLNQALSNAKKHDDRLNEALSNAKNEIIQLKKEKTILKIVEKETKNIGLKGISVADTKISNIDGERGKLIYRGYDILDLTKNSTFEETAYLLLYDRLPTRQLLDEFNTKLIQARYIPKQMQKNMGNWRKDANPMDMLQAFVSALAGYYDEEFSNKDASYDRAINLIAKVPTIIASWHRIRNELDPIEPDSSLGHAANFLYMMFGEKPDPEVEKIFDMSLILYADHMINISTFTARLVSSTRAHMYAAISAAIGASSGELFGGASSEVMKMILEIDSVNEVDSWVKKKIENGERIMGMGDVLYQTFDPRYQILKELSRMLSERQKSRWFDITERIEQTSMREMKQQKRINIYPNGFLYGASVYYMLNIPLDLNAAILAMTRSVGWASHIIEEKFAEAAPKPKMYKPKSEYIGKYCGPQGCEYIHLDLRAD